MAAPPGPAMVLTRVDGKTVSQAGTWPADVKSACSEGFSTSRTCEMSLSKQTETHFKSLFYLLDKVPRFSAPRNIGALFVSGVVSADAPCACAGVLAAGDGQGLNESGH